MSLKFSFILAVLLLVGCATPPQVKQLSVKQNEYFDAAIAAVSLQSTSAFGFRLSDTGHEIKPSRKCTG